MDTYPAQRAGSGRLTVKNRITELVSFTDAIPGYLTNLLSVIMVEAADSGIKQIRDPL
jgi:hypothetical protein